MNSQRYLITDGVLLIYTPNTDQYSVDTSPVRLFEPLGDGTKYFLNSDENVDTLNVRDNSVFLINPTSSSYYLLSDDNVAQSYTELTNTPYASSLVGISGVNMTYDSYKLMLAQGFSFNSNFGLHFNTYCVYNGQTFNLGALFDEAVNSNILPAPIQVRYENTFYTSEIEFRLPSLDTICNSDNAEISELRFLIFGTYETITTPPVFVEYALIDNQETITGGYRRYVKDFVDKISFIPKELSSGISLNCEFDENDKLELKVEYTGFGNLATYLSTLAEANDVWIIDYQVNVIGYDGVNIAQNDFISVRNEEVFDNPILYQVLLNNVTDSAIVNVTASIKNTRTNLVIERQQTLTIVDTTPFHIISPTTQLSINVDTVRAYNKVIKVEPQLSRNLGGGSGGVTNTVFVPVFSDLIEFGGEVVLREENSSVTLSLPVDQVDLLNNVQQTFLSIGGQRIKEEPRKKSNTLIFKISKDFYKINSNKYYVLDSQENVIGQGVVSRD